MTSLPLRAASVRFATLERSRWRAIVSSLAAVGFNAIEVPLVWSEHERSLGVFDFETGNRCLSAMREVVASAGLRFLVRVGPMNAGEASSFGVPERVLQERACQARTARGNPWLVPDGLRALALPSESSVRFLEECHRWLDAVMEALTQGGLASIDRVLVGDGPASWGKEPGAAVAFRQHLRTQLLGAGVAPSRLWTCVPNHDSVLLALAKEGPIVCSLPDPSSGTVTLWRRVRSLLSVGAPVLFSVRAGGAASAAPLRNSHAVAGARAVLAAGAQELVVRAGCAAGGWVGSIVSPEGVQRRGAQRWTELLRETQKFPTGNELSVELSSSLEVQQAEEEARVLGPTLARLLAFDGVPSGLLSANDADLSGMYLVENEQKTEQYESALQQRGLPWRRVWEGSTTAVRPEAEESATDFAERAEKTLGIGSVECSASGAALARCVQTEQERVWLALSAHHETVQVRVRKKETETEEKNWENLAPGGVLLWREALPENVQVVEEVPRVESVPVVAPPEEVAPVAAEAEKTAEEVPVEESASEEDSVEEQAPESKVSEPSSAPSSSGGAPWRKAQLDARRKKRGGKKR